MSLSTLRAEWLSLNAFQPNNSQISPVPNSPHRVRFGTDVFFHVLMLTSRMLASACLAIFNTATTWSMASTSMGLYMFAASQQLVISTTIFALLPQTLAWYAASHAITVMHMLFFHFYDATWHGHCHGYWAPSRYVHIVMQVYGAVFDNGIAYNSLLRGHRVHHKHCDDPSDMNLIFQCGIPKWNSYIRHQMSKVNIPLTIVVSLAHDALLVALFRREHYAQLALLLATGLFGRTATIWPAHFCRKSQPNACVILKPNQRTRCENVALMYLSPPNYSHAFHHDKQQLIYTDPRIAFDGHAFYLALLCAVGAGGLLRPTCEPLRLVDTSTYHKTFFSNAWNGCRG